MRSTPHRELLTDMAHGIAALHTLPPRRTWDFNPSPRQERGSGSGFSVEAKTRSQAGHRKHSFTFPLPTPAPTPERCCSWTNLSTQPGNPRRPGFTGLGGLRPRTATARPRYRPHRCTQRCRLGPAGSPPSCEEPSTGWAVEVGGQRCASGQHAPTDPLTEISNAYKIVRIDPANKAVPDVRLVQQSELQRRITIENARALRRELGLTQKDVAEAVTALHPGQASPTTRSDAARGVAAQTTNGCCWPHGLTQCCDSTAHWR